MRLVFLGYQNIGYRSLQALIELSGEWGDEIAAVVTHADDPGETLWFPAVRELAGAHYLPVFQPQSPNDPRFIEVLARLAPDFLISCYYRAMLSKPLLELPRRGALNLHGSLLPRYRGKCPVNWVLIHGETETGVTLHYMEEKPDRGDIVAQRRVPILPEDTALSLNEKLAQAAAALWRDIYPALRAGTAPRTPQDHTRASYFGGRRPADGRIDWGQRAQDVYNLVRAVTHPYPGAFTAGGGKKLFIWQARPLAPGEGPAAAAGQVVSLAGGGVAVGTGEGLLQILQAQFEGEAMLAGEALTARLQECQGGVGGRIQ